MTQAKDELLTFVSLQTRLLSASITENEVLRLLNLHRQPLLDILLSVDPSGLDSKITYYRHAEAASRFPVPTDGEAACIESLQTHFSIPRSQAGNLIRDYLAETNTESLSTILENSTNFSELIPLHGVKSFWLSQLDSAIFTLLNLLTAASDPRHHLLHKPALAIVSENEQIFKRTILQCANFVISSYATAPANSLANTRAACYMSLLFALTLCSSLTVDERKTLLSSYCSLGEQKKRSRAEASDRGTQVFVPRFDGTEVSLLFVAAINNANSMRSVTKAFSSDEPTNNVTTLVGKQMIELLSEEYRKLRSDPCPETAVLFLSWSSLLKLEERRHHSLSTSSFPKNGDSEVVRYMSFAVTNNVFMVIQKFVTDDIPVRALLAPYVFYCLWDDVVAFFTAFPPRCMLPHQVSQIVLLATSLLHSMRESDIRDIANDLWKAESAKRLFGVNALLRIASGVFPQTYRPLVTFLSALIVHEDIAKEVLLYLTEKLSSITESSEAYGDVLYVLDEDEKKVLNSICLEKPVDVEGLSTVLEMVRFSDEDIVFVQAAEDISADTYRPQILKGSIGLMNLSQTVVTWLIRWNGFGAVSRILQFLLSLFNNQDSVAQYNDSILEELVIIAADSMTLIDRLFAHTSPETAHDYLASDDLIRMIAAIVTQSADPSEQAKSLWLTKARQERLLTAAASCLASVTCGDPKRAHFALELLGLFRSTFPFVSAVSSLGESSFPPIAALARIAYISARGDIATLKLEGLLSSPRYGNERFSPSAWLNEDASHTSSFLVENALPLWLTFVRDGKRISTNENLHWLLASCSLELFASNPSFILQSPTVSSVFSSVILAVSEEFENVFDFVLDPNLFSALRSALSVCYIALRERNRWLQKRAQHARENKSKFCGMDTNCSTEEVSPFERTLLKPEIARSIVMLSTGLVAKIKRNDFFDSPARSTVSGFMSNLDLHALWTLCPNPKIRDIYSAEYWRTWITEISARCLSLLFCCLSQQSGNDSVQIAWPSVRKALGETWRPGGESIRDAMCHMIEMERSLPHIELAVTVLACGQRAAARSLLAPPSASHVLHRQRTKTSSSDNRSVRVLNDTNDSDQKQKLDHHSAVMCAVVKCLNNSYQTWVELVAVAENDESDDSVRSLSQLIEIGQSSLRIVACVRFLRVAWESQNHQWFQGCWNDLKVWELLGDLVRCNGSSSRRTTQADFARAISFQEVSEALIAKLQNASSLDWSGLRSTLQDIAVATDVSACWKAISADVLQVFAAEISFKTTAYLKSSGVEKSGKGKEEGHETLPLELFKEESFAVFRSVFSERWMHILFKVTDHPNETSNALERRMSRRSLHEFHDNRSEIKRTSVEHRSQEVSMFLCSLISPGHAVNDDGILRLFDRAGEVTTRFGIDYCFDPSHVLHVLQLAGRTPQEARKALINLSRLNVDMTIQDVQAEVVRTFSAMSSAVVFADSFCPQNSLTLSYSSPQFGGKVCRYLSRYLLFLSPMLSSSGHAIGIASEISMLLASLSSRLSTDELEQAALTSVRFQSLALPEDLGSLNVVGQLCVAISDVLESVEGSPLHENAVLERLEILRWLLLTASKLSHGVAYRSRSDLIALTRCVMNVLQRCGRVAFISSACSVALSAVLEERIDDWVVSLDASDTRVIVKTISSLSSVSDGERETILEICANLLLNIARGYFVQGNVDNSTRSFIIHQLSGGTTTGLLPPESEIIDTYDSTAEFRNSSHILWCACLRLAGIAIPDALESRRHGGGESEIRDVLEFTCATIERIGRDSFSLSGDWPSSHLSTATDESKCITIAKVEEAELAALVLFRLSGYAFHLRSAVPESLRTVVAELMRYVDHALRLLRAEPVERWVRPITRRERERSYLLRGGRDSHGNIISTGNSPPWSGSPVRTQSPGSPAPSKRSPMQALRAAIGDSSGRGSPIPSSPGFTPASPSTGMPGSEQMSSSPLSPWIPYGAGLISETGLYFGEEVSRSLLRGLASALSALRRFAFEIDVVLFSTSLISFDDPPGLGSLMNLLHHAGGELQRGTDDTRRNLLLSIAENAFILMVFHVRQYMVQDALPQHVKDELRKRIPTYIMRMRRSIPPPPNTSVLTAVEIDRLWDQLR